MTTDPVQFVDQRLGTNVLLRKATRYVFPEHWSFLLGEIALYSFFVLIATGTFLALFFDASTTQITIPTMPRSTGIAAAAYQAWKEGKAEAQAVRL